MFQSYPIIKPFIKWFVGVFVGVGLLGVALYLFSSKPFDTLSGSIFLTLAPKGDRAVDLYEFDIVSRKFSKIFDDNFIKLTGKISPSGEQMTFVSARLDRSSNFYLPSKDFLQIRVYDKRTKEFRTLTDSPDVNKRIAGWSPDGQHIAYTSQISNFGTDGFFEPDKWSVKIINMNGDIEDIGSGTHPLWFPDGQFLLYLKNNGLYLYDLAEKKSSLVHTVVGGNASTNMKLDISNDGSQLAWSIPNRQGLYFYKIVSRNPFSMELIRKIDTGNSSVFWPVYSPDGRYVIFQEADKTEDPSVLSNPRLVVYDLKKFARLKVADIGEYNFDAAFISDWR